MNTKLTLTIEEDVIKRAKDFAKQQNRSLSDIIENYLKSITKNKVEDKDEELPPIIKSLKGSLKLAGDVDYKEELMKRLEEKYLK
jgi:predicted CopG family antitoxin